MTFLLPSNSVPPVSSEVIVSICHNIIEKEEVMNGDRYNTYISSLYSWEVIWALMQRKEKILNSTVETRHSHNYGKQWEWKELLLHCVVKFFLKKTWLLLKAVLCSRHFEHPPNSIQWGKDYEHRASQEYLKHAKSHGKKNLSIRKCGFLIHPVVRRLGVSPDACVMHPYSDLPEDIAEF